MIFLSSLAICRSWFFSLYYILCSVLTSLPVDDFIDFTRWAFRNFLIHKDLGISWASMHYCNLLHLKYFNPQFWSVSYSVIGRRQAWIWHCLLHSVMLEILFAPNFLWGRQWEDSILITRQRQPHRGGLGTRTPLLNACLLPPVTPYFGTLIKTTRLVQVYEIQLDHHA